MRFLLSATVALATVFVASFAHGQGVANPCAPGRPLLQVPEIKHGNNGKLQGTIILSDEKRQLAGGATGTPCDNVQLRYFKGHSLAEPNKPWPSTGDVLPGPTLRARVGDLVQLAFLNQVNPSNFPTSLDQAERGNTDACDSARAQRQKNPAQSVQIYPRNDSYPNCLHGSSTANLHFHGTHTTPSTTGDNVLLYIRPALRQGNRLEPTDDFVTKQFTEFFKWCDDNGSPTNWKQMPALWQQRQKDLLQEYDKTAAYKGVIGALPEKLKLWPVNDKQINDNKWPQYSVGAFPHCFRLPTYDPAKVKMGQAPGTHWYHAHKHGSTALNVGNGMTGAFVIEGAYDDELKSFYKETPQHKNWGLTEQVLVIQQLASGLNLLSAGNIGGPAPLSVNGRLTPVLTMKPNQVQLWRIVNGAPHTFVQFVDAPQTTKPGAKVTWRQTAQDGVQFAFKNYQRVGTVNGSFNLATANRADILVKAPAAPGDYNIPVIQSISDVPAGTPSTLLTVRVRRDDKPIDPPMDFIQTEADFPKLPPFLKDIDEPIIKTRYLTFDTQPFSDRAHVSKAGGKGGTMPLHKINDQLFNEHVVDQEIPLNTTEEWMISNKTINIAHPFHIHINPFQITELFQPNSAEAKDPSNPCYADPYKPETWKACKPLPAPWVWWDVFSIPTARQEVLPCTKVEECPANIQKFTRCEKFPVGNPVVPTQQCRVTIPGYFKFVSRFVDFTGQYVLHCHILAHEDRGMMQLVEVATKRTSPYGHQ